MRNFDVFLNNNEIKLVSENKNHVWTINEKEKVYNYKSGDKIKFLLKEIGKDLHLLND